MDVTVVHISDWIMERQLDRSAGKMLQAALEKKGMKFKMSAHTAELVKGESGRVCAVRFKDGSTPPADLVCMAAGIRPNVALAEQAGIHCNRGIVVNDTCRPSRPAHLRRRRMHNHRGTAYGLVAPLFEQAKVCANHHLPMYGIGRYQGSVTSTKLKVTGIDVFSAGDFSGSDGTEDIVLHDPGAGIYKRLVLKDDKLVGAVLCIATPGRRWYFQLLKDAQDIHDIRDNLVFGNSHLGDVGHKGNSLAAGMPDSAEVCGCNGVCKGSIVKAIKGAGPLHARRREEAHQGVELLRLLHRPGRADPRLDHRRRLPAGRLHPQAGVRLHRPLHGEVRRAIREHKLLSVPRPSSSTGRRPTAAPAAARPSTTTASPAGPTRPSTTPEPLHQRARPPTSRRTAPIRWCRAWGRPHQPAELRAIADAAEKYKVPTVKVTGGQRIDLLGVKKEDLPAMWADFMGRHGLGPRLRQSLRTVKTCVGSEHCRFGTSARWTSASSSEDAVRHGSPHKFKLAVSGCPRNCAESGIRTSG